MFNKTLLQIKLPKWLKRNKSIKIIGSNENRKFKTGFGSVTDADIGNLTEALARTLKVGIPLNQAMFIVMNLTTNKKFKNVLKICRQFLQEGSSLSEALGVFPKYFPKNITEVIKAGETGGQLAEILEKIAISYKRKRTMNRKVRGAMIMPVSVLLVAVGVIILLVKKIVPEFSKQFLKEGLELPLVTKILFEFSNVLNDHFLLFIGGLFGIALLFYSFFQTQWGKLLKYKAYMKLPILSTKFAKPLYINTFLSVFGVMQKAGISVPETLEKVKEATPNIYYKREYSRIIDDVSNGISLAESMSRYEEHQKNKNKKKNNSKLSKILNYSFSKPKEENSEEVFVKNPFFPTELIAVIRIGEESGQLAEVFEDQENINSEELKENFENVSRLIEPVMTFGIGGIVLVILLAIFSPYMSLIENAINEI